MQSLTELIAPSARQQPLSIFVATLLIWVAILGAPLGAP